MVNNGFIMNTFLRIHFLLFLVTPFLCFAQKDKVIEPPNVLMICIDDLNDWVGFLGGHQDAKTPHMDKLAAAGRNFTNAHCVVPVCSPSRVSIMSGLHATTHGSYDLGTAYENIKRLDNVATIQGHFKSNGYLSIGGGKILHHGFNGKLKKDFDQILGGKKGGPRPKKRMNFPGGAWDWGAFPEKDEQMGDYQLAQNASQVLRKKHDKPFFLTVGIFRPHVPMFVPQKWFDLYDKEKIKLPNNPISDLDDLPPNFKGRLNVEPTHEDILKKGDWRGMLQAYLACVSFADHCVGEVMEGLNEGPNKDNTIVVLWSDHGFHLGEKQKWAKRTLWEESTRTPFIISGPGIKPGACAEAVSLLDIFPTLVELSGIKQPEQLDGLSLNSQLKNPKAERTKPVLISSYYENHSIRNKRWRYIRYKDGAEELYDHSIDKDEFTNLAKNPEYDSIKKSLAKWLPKNAALEVKKSSSKRKNKK
jgi:choline-sulfatase